MEITKAKVHGYVASVVVGVDEAGRGPLAGSVIVAGVIADDIIIDGVFDSKKLSEKKREMLFEQIIKTHKYAIAEVNCTIVDEVNILQATKLGMRMVIDELKATLALIDGNHKCGSNTKEIPIIGGDGKVYEIAAASIVAKVHRDRQMLELDTLYPQYGFAKHKGYGTKVHIDAIKEKGLSPIHRKTFCKKLLQA
jgi:ribonuclease HII